MSRTQTIRAIFPTEETSTFTLPGGNELKVPFRKFVKGIFQDILERPPVEADVESWTEQLVAGVERAEPISALFRSQEKREKMVREQYRTFLGRVPNAEGLALFTGLISSGKRIEEVMACVLSSSEYFTKNGGNAEGFIRALFRDVLQRQPKDMEDDSLIGLLASQSVSRMAIAHDFVTCDEYRMTQIRNWFQKFLKRLPESEVMQNCLNELKEGTTQEQVQTTLLGSREYFTRVLV